MTDAIADDAAAPKGARPEESYRLFLARKSQLDADGGFAPTFVPPQAFAFQEALIDWACRRGRGAIFADTGLGKTLVEAALGENVVRRTGGRVLVLTPLAVGAQWVREAQKFGVEASRGAVAGPGIYVANYERLHHYDPNDFVACIADESSILKNFDGATRAAVTEFMRRLRWRWLLTATPAPNDFVELGTSSEALGYLGHMDMLNRFFKNDSNTSDTKRKWVGHGAPRHNVGPGWRFRGHAEVPFWRWVCSWARALRKPSDLGPGFAADDARFQLPPLLEREHVVAAARPRDGMLFALPAVGLAEQREERRRTLDERCEKVAALCAPRDASLVWCHLNDEGDLLERLVPGAVQVSGRDDDDAKERKLLAFADGQVKALVIKPAIGALGLNFQRCAHQTWFASHSFQDFYQGVRRSHRFGQARPVEVDIVATDGEVGVLANLQRKAAQAERMFARLVEFMREGQQLARAAYGEKREEMPRWLCSTR